MSDRAVVRCSLISGAVLGVLLFAGCAGTPDGIPRAAFTVMPPSGLSPLVVTMDASGSYDPDGAIVRYDWTFGDGTVGTGRSPVHTYTVESETTFDVGLTVVDNDGHEAGATAYVTVFPAPPTEAARVEFVWPFHYDAEGDDAANLNDEYFTLQNLGTVPVDLGGWTVSNERGDVFRFPDGTVLAAGGHVFVHSGGGTDTGNVFHWNAEAPVWNNDGDVAILYDASGVIVDIYAYASC